MYNRKLLTLMVDAANFALTAPLTGGRLVKNFRPYISRAPPKKIFEPYATYDDELVYSRIENNSPEVEIDQSRPDSDDDFNQDPNW